MEARRCFRSSRRGMTLLEVLVVIAITGLLLALLLGAVQRARSASQRIDCASRLRQVWLGVDLYEETYGNFPTQFLHPMQPFIRPYLEDHGDGNFMPFLRCPADPYATGDAGMSRCSYLPCDGVRGDLPNMQGIVGSHEGDFPVRLARDVVDGLSQTAGVAEKLAVPEDFQSGNVPEELWIRLTRRTAVHHTSMEEFADECQFRAQQPNAQGVPVVLYNHIMTPNGNSCGNGFQEGYASAFTASSLHGGGVNVSMADGAVRFVSDGIDRKTWWALGTINGNEVLGDF